MMQVTRAAFQAVASLNEQATDPKSHTLVRITYTLSSPVLSPANSDGRPQVQVPHKHYHRTLHYFARLWFESDNRDPGSFEWICDQLDLDSSWLRRRLLEVADRRSTGSMRHRHVRVPRQAPEEVSRGERLALVASDVGFDSS